MSEFKKAGARLQSLLGINVKQKVVVDYFGDKGRDVRDDFIALIGITADIKEVNSPLPKAIRRFEIQGKSVGPSTLIGEPGGLSVAIIVSVTPEQKFIEGLAAAALPVAKEKGVPMSVLLGVACVESAFGTGPHAGKNLFGITKKAGQNWFPACKRTQGGTTEAIAGKGNTGDSFCLADSLENNTRIFCEFIKDHPNGGKLASLYKAGPWTDAELQTFPTVLHDSMNFGMGKTTAEYRDTVMAVIRQQDLRRFDP